MNQEEAIEFTDRLVFNNTGKHLTNIQRHIIQNCWHKRTKYDEMADILSYEPQHVKNEGASLWKIISKEMGKNVNKSNFQQALEKHNSSITSNNLAFQFNQILLTEPEPSVICSFLRDNPKIIQNIFNTDRNSYICYACSLNSQMLDVCVGNYQPTTAEMKWNITLLRPVSGDIITSVDRQISEINNLRIWCDENLENVRESLPGFKPNFFCDIVAGRRNTLSQEIRVKFKSINEMLGFRVRTYDWLLDKATSLSTLN